MPLVLLLVGLAALGRLVGGDDDRPDVKVTYLLPVGKVIFIPGGMKALTGDGLVLRGPVHVRADSVTTETVFVDLGVDGTQSIRWS